jgi:LPXTG-site transpeptidase (sortase) family protein
VAGVLLLLYAAGAYAGILPGGESSVPEPAALSQRGGRVARQAPVRPTVQALPTSGPSLVEPVVADGLATSSAPAAPRAEPARPLAVVTDREVPPSTEPPATSVLPATPGPPPIAADLEDRRDSAVRPRPGIPVRLQIPSIKVDTEVKIGGIVRTDDGESEWETLPFVGTYYPQLGLVGAAGNPVIAGHVVTRFMGNVFRDLYQVDLGEPIVAYTDRARFTYEIVEIKLVSPDAVEVMAPTEDARLTLITCGGTFDPKTRSFSDRLVVVGSLVGAEKLS